MPLEYTAPTTLPSHNIQHQQHFCHTIYSNNNTAVTQYTAPTTLLSHNIQHQQHCCHTIYSTNNTAVTQYTPQTTQLSHNTCCIWSANSNFTAYPCHVIRLLKVI